MTDFSEEKWQRIKFLAARLQAIKNLLDSFNQEDNNQPFTEEVQNIKTQLEAEFETNLDELLKLIDDNKNNNNHARNETNNH
ncbi:hypothetical protein NIES2119_29280 [[Phormidium ambiguum] IAM M-71]|uniref:Uncharacterized protein n=1 Tax=[Phormidium ambiguum] IAM M-71 TaxID=454136 RepID=A0A1U7I4N5_9CYAN|nr:hypothetical protein [Phormidium ambiguum]OKH31179.1 hypothetical protein NIES2119_29280 [Phormidium ambiguum IAM M-71]